MALNPFAEAGKAQLYKMRLDGVSQESRFKAEQKKKAADNLAKQKSDAQKKKDLEIKFKDEQAWDVDEAYYTKQVNDIMSDLSAKKAANTLTEQELNSEMRKAANINLRRKGTAAQAQQFYNVKSALESAKPGTYSDDAKEAAYMWRNPENYDAARKEMEENGWDKYQYRIAHPELLDINKQDEFIDWNEYADKYKIGTSTYTNKKDGHLTENKSVNMKEIKDLVTSTFNSKAPHSDISVLYSQYKKGHPNKDETDFITELSNSIYNKQNTASKDITDEDKSGGYLGNKKNQYKIGETSVSRSTTGSQNYSIPLNNSLIFKPTNDKVFINKELAKDVTSKNMLSDNYGTGAAEFKVVNLGFPPLVATKDVVIPGTSINIKEGQPITQEGLDYINSNNQKGLAFGYENFKSSNTPYLTVNGTLKKTAINKPVVLKTDEQDNTKYYDDGKGHEIVVTKSGENQYSDNAGNDYESYKDGSETKLKNKTDSGVGKDVTAIIEYDPRVSKLDAQQQKSFNEMAVKNAQESGEWSKAQQAYLNGGKKPKGKTKKVYINISTGNTEDVSGLSEQDIKDAIKFGIIKVK